MQLGMSHCFLVRTLQAQILAASLLVVVFAVLVATMAAKLHVPGHALQLVLDRALEIALTVVVDRVPEVVITHAPVLAQVAVADVTAVVGDVLETVDLVVTIVAVVLATGAGLPVHLVAEQVEADSAEIVASSVIVNGGLYA